jgi:hypothetical protein
MEEEIVSHKEEKVKQLPWLARVYGTCYKYRHDIRRNIAAAAGTLTPNVTLNKQQNIQGQSVLHITCLALSLQHDSHLSHPSIFPKFEASIENSFPTLKCGYLPF